ncbi:ABC transporter substrate-binding protein [Ponticoccus sp. SC2-23]|uniref:ABC transporter substrate-binding protein n=1 Tax=Alexandriicola marinus TaxID=2081710 RepID=UPI000FDA730B|nr:ABC transporter substrate-binding protein [Alexandriicola marinus]MBM1220793.1 ABC transporter substrate-binding protein [Ponticoccus sp. SC6-9]MBM1225363.1 ABC transporter substrate-binding protein [Ponticoccus sp. SC6-15]MBM1227546.1 ABC transporter substrate-binding protein [Ponticoccus sp. SC6-38]MBM1234816.1 ABC transporter substrate-binding protein [Ponticoccus sp. SC6-45]MBM1238048.1 ABC transporter substrate-binding protein [Ponticoccus sp. SC6-49]MBM1244319.1 ABC transporter subst
MKILSRAALPALMLGVSATALTAQMVEPTTPPPAPEFSAQGEPVFVNRSDMFEYRALESYNEPEFVSAFVEAGMLPPVAERLPAEPMVYKAGNMPDGIGDYGGTLRHVIGGRPEGWNYWGGQSQGWGGIDIGMTECLTRTGPLFTINPEDLEPMPNLAKSWEWSDDGMMLTVNLIEGAHWSDGDPFDTEDIDFYWNDIVMNGEVTPLNGATQTTYGEGTTLEIVDDYTFTMTFTTAFPESVLYNFAYGNFCPGPSHVLKPVHPSYSDNTMEQFINAFPPEDMGFPVMGAWVPVEYRADDIIVLRRNPYYWKVDEEGNQLPYLDEVHYRLSTWADRDVQAVAGTGDFSNLEQPENYVESLRRSAEDDAPARLAFGPRTIGYTLYPNLSGNGWGEPDERAQAVRELNRNADFRKGITQAMDRVRLGESLVKGPFTVQYPGGLYAGTSYYDEASTVFYPYSLESARAHFEAAGLADTDGDGFYNWPEGMMDGGNVQITILANTDYQTDRNLAEGVVAMLEEAGIQAALNLLTGNDRDAAQNSGRYDWMVLRNGTSLITVVQNTTELAPVGAQTSLNHRANADGELDLLPWEQEMVDVVNAFIGSRDAAERSELMSQYQRLYTENLYGVGLTAYPGALIINKRFANIPAGAPIFMYNWAEDNIIRERVYVPADAQADHELHPNTLPGDDGPVTAG